jgi:collagen type I alpha
MGAVISFFRPATTCQGGWSQQELAEFYRVEAALIRAGLQIGSEQGLSDEADPWFVFCRPDGDAVMHFARIDGSYVIASDVLDSPMRGSDFRALINEIARRYPELLPIPQDARGTKLSVHPAALLAALVAAAALSLSPDDARADDGERSTESAAQPPHAGHAQQHGPSEARDTGDADERDGHRKQVGLIVFSAMVFAADALVDHPAQGIEATSYLGARGASSAVPGDQGSLSPTTGGAASPVQSEGPLGTGRHEGPASGAAGLVTAESAAVASARSDAADFGLIGLRDPALGHGPTRAGAESGFQPLARGAEASAALAAGSSSSPDSRSDGGAAPSGDAAAREQGAPSSSATGEAPSLAQSVTPTTGHAASEAPPAPVNGLNAAAQPELRHAQLPVEERSGSPDNDPRTGVSPEARGRHDAVAHADPSGIGAGASEREVHGAAGDPSAASDPSPRPTAGLAQIRGEVTDQGRGQDGDGPGRSADAPGHHKDAAAVPLDVAGGASPDEPPGLAQAQTSTSDPGPTRAGEGPGRSAAAPGHLRGSAPHAQDNDGQGTDTGTQSAPPSATVQASGAVAAHAQAGEGPGRSAEAPGPLQGPAGHAQDAGSHGTAATDPTPSAPAANLQIEARAAEPDHRQAGEGPVRSALAPEHVQDTAPHARDAGHHGSAANTDPVQPSASAQTQADVADPGHARAGASPGRSAEAPGHLHDTAPPAQDSRGHGSATDADPGPPSAGAQARAADPGHGQDDRSGEPPGHLQDNGPHAQGSAVHSAASDADPIAPSASALAGVRADDPGHAQTADGPGRSGEAADHARETEPHLRNSDGSNPATGANAGISPSGTQDRAVEADPNPANLDAGPHHTGHGTAVAAANVGTPVASDQSLSRQGSGGSTGVSRDQEPPGEPSPPTSGGSHGPRPAASIGPNGTIEFASDSKPGSPAGPSHAPADSGVHGDVGLIGVSDHGANAHHFDFHS